MRARLGLSIALSTMAACPLPAQSVGRMFVDDVHWAAQDFASLWLSPFKGDGRDYAIASAVLAGGAAFSLLDDDVDRWAVRNHDRHFLSALKPIRAGGDFYSLNRATPYVAAAYLVALASKQRGLRDGIFGCASAYAAGSTMRHQLTYRFLGRDRPDTLRDRPPGTLGAPSEQGDQYQFEIPARGWPAQSFPGGHTATMATCASFFAHRYDAKYIDAPLIALVTAMGVGRIADRGHWLSDQVLGVAMGYAMGKEVARRQLERLAKERGPACATEGCEPTADRGTMLMWTVRF